MRVINIRGVEVDALVGPQHGASRIFIWCVTAQAGQTIGMHHHEGEELIRVLYGRLKMRVGDQRRELSAGEVVIIPAGTRHGYRALEDSEIEVYGEIGMGEFITLPSANGESPAREVFVKGQPWSRSPSDESQYISHAELLERYRESALHDPID